MAISGRNCSRKQNEGLRSRRSGRSHSRRPFGAGYSFRGQNGANSERQLIQVGSRNIFRHAFIPMAGRRTAHSASVCPLLIRPLPTSGIKRSTIVREPFAKNLRQSYENMVSIFTNRCSIEILSSLSGLVLRNHVSPALKRWAISICQYYPSRE